jgi:hypothetical protein
MHSVLYRPADKDIGQAADDVTVVTLFARSDRAQDPEIACYILTS